MRNKFRVFSLLVILIAFSSVAADDYTTTETGLQYKITEQGKGEQANKGEKVKVHYTGKLENGEVFDSSIDRGKPFEFELGAGRVIKGWDEGIALLKVGDKATFIIPPELGYGERNLGKIPANSTLIFDVELLEIVKAPKITSFDVTGIEAIYSQTGLKFYVIDQGEGESPKKGDMVTVHYSGYLEDGTMFDSSVERGQPFQFELGAGRVIKGWDEGVSFMKKGGKIRFVIPYNLAYGEEGRPPKIPPKADLTFDIELIDF